MTPSRMSKVVISVKGDGRSSAAIPCCRDSGEICVVRANSCLIVLMAHQFVSAVVRELVVAQRP